MKHHHSLFLLVVFFTLGSIATSPRSAQADLRKIGRVFFRMCVSEDRGMIFRKRCKGSRGEEEVSLLTLPEWGSVRLNGIPSGHVVHGVAGFDDHAAGAGNDFSHFVSFPTQLGGGSDVASSNVLIATTTAVTNTCGAPANCIAAGSIDTGNECTGDVDNPTAPAGKVCIYPATLVNINILRANASPEDPSRYGFELRGSADAAGDVYTRTVWAYQQP